MKKIIGAAAAGLVLTGAAFADASISAQAQIQSNVFSYTSPSNGKYSDDIPGRVKDTNGRGTDDVGTVKWAQDTKHKDDITLNASTDNAGAKIVFNVSSNTNNTDSTSLIKLTSYQLWANFGKIRVDAGAYDQRLGKNLNNDGNWNSNYSGVKKPGIWASIDGANWGADSTNITSPVNQNKLTTNFQVSTALNDQLTVRGVLFLNTNGTTANGTDSSSDPWIFAPFALGAVYKPSKTSQIAVVGKLNSITLGSSSTKETAATKRSYSITKTIYADGSSKYTSVDTHSDNSKGGKYYYDTSSNSFRDKTESSAPTEGTILYEVEVTEAKAGTTTYEYSKPQNSVWTLAFDYWNQLNSNLQIEATYTLGASLYTNNGKHGAHWDSTNKGNSKHLVRDNDVFAHGFDFRVVDKLSSQLTLTGIASVNYVQSTAVDRSKNRNTPTKDEGYKDALAKSYGESAAGTLAYYATVSADYAASDTVTYQLQAKLLDNNLFETTECDSGKHDHVDYLSGMELNIRPAILLNVDKTQFFAGFDFGIKGFQTYATGKNNTVYTTYAIPIGLRFKM